VRYLAPLGGAVLEFLLAATALGLWQIILRRSGRLPAWALGLVRGLVLLVVVGQGGLYAWVTWRGRSVPVAEIGPVLAEIQRTTDLVHQGSAAALVIAAIPLIAFTVWRRRPVEPPTA